MRRRRFEDDAGLVGMPRVRAHFLGQVLGAVGGIAGGLLGAKSERDAQKAANRANAERYAAALGQHSRAYSIASGFIDQAGTIMGDRVGMVDQAAEQSRSEIEDVGRTARTNILEREQQGAASARQSLTSRGLGQSTVLAGAERGIALDTNRALNELNERIAMLRSSNILSGSQMRARAQGEHADFLMRAGGMHASLIQDRINTIIGRTDVPNPNAGGQYAGLGEFGGAVGGVLDNIPWGQWFGGGGGFGGFGQGVGGVLGPPSG